MKNLNLMRWILLIAGILMVILGVSMFSTPLENILGFATFICIAMIASGISEVIAYFTTAKPFRSGWMLVSGILTTILGIWVVKNQGIEVVATMLPFMFAIWILYAGISRIVGSISMKGWGFRNWALVLVMGILSTISGVILIFMPVASGVTLAFMIPVMFIVHGISNITLFFSTKV